ncbi:ImcF-related family protein [Thorsellia anophelis]|uniref:Type VI secretion system protein ImpL n=1 Tax=Thorsellia anophelis DSM 18579 TaxID=1123402 RepID=A0A1I0FTW0_9GAMM|nr:ImcF-related family protein [Thorsellia anophelis]SET61672.1 type VI secretion system protein ImpL [Thorsellia anophelis DSM 18579]
MKFVSLFKRTPLLIRCVAMFLALVAAIWILLFFIQKYYTFTLPITKHHFVLIASGILTLVYLLFEMIKKMFYNFGRDTSDKFEPNNVHGEVSIKSSDDNKMIDIVHNYLFQHYGRFWRNRIKIYCVIGQSEEVNHQLPHLIEEGWQEHNGVLIVWGGEALAPIDNTTLMFFEQFHVKPFDAIVWLASASVLKQTHAVNQVVMHLIKREISLRWRAPLYTIALYEQDRGFQNRWDHTVGIILPKHPTNKMIKNQLNSLVIPLTSLGMQSAIAKQVNVNQVDSNPNPNPNPNLSPNPKPMLNIWISIANQLIKEDSELFSNSFASMFNRSRSIYLKGVLFSINRYSKNSQSSDLMEMANRSKNSWVPDLTWQGIIDTTDDEAAALGFNWVYISQLTFLALLLSWSAGSLMSFMSNRQTITSIDERMQTLSMINVTSETKLSEQLTLQQDIERLNHQLQTGLPLFSRFGLNRHEQLLNRLWEHYEYSVLPFLQKGSEDNLRQHLQAWLALPPNSPKRTQQQQVSYNALKTYLMLTQPSKTDANFLQHNLTHHWQQQSEISEVIWQSTGYKLLGFFADHLHQHPNWAIKRDDDLVASVRTALLRQIGISNGETNLYQAILRNASRNYSELTLDQMVGDTDYSALFSLQVEEGEFGAIPGMFTRQAYEEQIQKAIEQAANARREEIDWVLSDNPDSIQSTDTPEALAARLTERYFIDYSSAWLQFLNRLRWRDASSLSDSIDQLTLLADSRQSPLIALFNTISFHSQAGIKTVGLGDSLLSSAQNVFKTEDRGPRIETEEELNQQDAMAATFTPLLNLMSTQAGNNELSLQAYITRITRLRLKLQQAANAPNPDAMMRALAQTVFQGTSVDLSDTRDYGRLMAETLGAQWSGLGQSLFVQPLEQSWQQVLTPTTESLNTQWQQSVVDEWNRAFQGRFPFTNSSNDTSLPLLGQFIRPDSGRLDQFFSRQLAGVMQKEGNRWVPNVLNTQGMSFDPDFINAINQLADIAEIMYLTGDASIRFELLARPSNGVSETQLLVDGQHLRYFNQVESWQPFTWPGNLLTTGARLNWSQEEGGMRIYAEHPGPWGFIRLLRQAKVKQLDSSTYQLTFNQKNGPSLIYILRTQLDSGPLALLLLQDFKLPKRIFLTGNGELNTVSSVDEALTNGKRTVYNYGDIPQAWQGDEEPSD